MANNSQRTYGQGAQGESSAPKANKFSLAAKLKYNFDNSIARSGVFVVYVLLAMIVFSAVIVLIKYSLYAVPFISNSGSLPGMNFETFWGSFSTILGRGTEATWADRIVAFCYWVITVALTGSVTGFIVGAIQRTFERLRKGKSPIIDNGHTLILGWSNRVFPILKELAVANQNIRKPKIVIFSDKTRDFMEDEIESRAGDLGKLKVITRTGDVTNPEDLKRSNVSEAKSIIILDEDAAGDANIVSTVLAVKAVNANPLIKIVAELDDAHTAEALNLATNGQVIAVRSHDVIARVTAQASRRPGLAAVILDLLDFDGDEIYFAEVPALSGKTYSEALLAFNTASVIGLVDANGKTHINPALGMQLEDSTKIIAIAEDDDKIVYTGVREDLGNQKVISVEKKAQTAEHLLIIGWSSMGRSLLNELAGFLPRGSTVHMVYQSRWVAASEFESLSFGDIKVTHSATSGDIHDLIEAAKDKKYNEVIVLGYRNAISEAEADAQTMLTMLQMNQLFITEGNGVEQTRLVAEIIDSRKAELARIAAVDDMVVSDSLAALLIAQISENPALAPVFEDLFDADGATMNVRPIEDYVPLGKAIDYAELVAIARGHGESAIGYRRIANATKDGSTGVELNPAKTTSYTPVAGDALVVIGDLS